MENTFTNKIVRIDAQESIENILEDIGFALENRSWKIWLKFHILLEIKENFIKFNQSFIFQHNFNIILFDINRKNW